MIPRSSALPREREGVDCFFSHQQAVRTVVFEASNKRRIVRAIKLKACPVVGRGRSACYVTPGLSYESEGAGDVGQTEQMEWEKRKRKKENGFFTHAVPGQLLAARSASLQRTTKQ